jgi:FkbH-like protein
LKCLVWDLDGTVWDGTLLEGGARSLRPGVADALRTLDGRGIVNSIASRNDESLAMRRLEELGVAELFVEPRIAWVPKSASVAAIGGALDIALDTVGFVDDDPFERDEVARAHPEVPLFDAADVASLVRRPELDPPVVTPEARRRRQMIRTATRRRRDEAEFEGTPEDFLHTLGMELTVRPAAAGDLLRAEELTTRTSQLNSTGRVLARERLAELAGSPDHLLVVADLEDVYGPYGTVGLALVERGDASWTLDLLVVSCRVIARGIGTVLLHHLVRRARADGAAMRARLIPTARNRPMQITFRMNGFGEVERDGAAQVLEHAGDVPAEPPPWICLRVA